MLTIKNKQMPLFNLDDCKLEYEWHGPDPSSAGTLVFLHGGLGSLAAWKDYPAQVAKATGLGALAYSRIGYGNSDPAPLPRKVSFMHEEALIYLPKVLQAFNIREATFIGHSDGGSIAIIYCGSEASSVPIGGLILEAPHVFVEDVTIQSISESVKEYQTGGLKNRLSQYHRDVDHTFLGWSAVWLDPEFRTWNIEGFLPQVKTRILVIQGEDDAFGSLAHVESIQKQSGGPVTTKIFPDCGHRPHRRYPNQTLQAIVNFLCP
jgi:pimeloyl-ACP methyl ester carboxylesterase